MKSRFLSALSVCLLFAGFASAAKPSTQDSLYEEIRKNLGMFGDVYRELSLRYVDAIDPEQFLRAGIDGMLSTLDPYTVFIPEDETEDLEVITSGRYGGVGIEIGVRGNDKVLTVITAMDDSPAQHVGIRSGDRIIRIDTVSTEGFSTSDAAKYLRGVPGTPVTITILRNGSGEPIEFVITRKEIEVKDVPYFGFVKPGIGYIKLAHFSREAPDDLDEALHDLKSKGLTALILDLRGNPGGLLSSAVAVAQRFCAKGETVVSVRGRAEESTQEFKLSNDPLAGEIPLAVLVDGGSASASEIVAGAVQDLDRGVLIGEPTFGKGLVQSVVSFETGEALKLTTAKYYTPSGRLIQRVDYFHENEVVLADPAELDTNFATRNGRPVEGGGGIEPDIELPAPHPGPLGTELWRQGSFFDFVSDYRARHPQLTSAQITDESLAEFRRWLDSTDFHYDADGQELLDSLRALIAEVPQAASAETNLQGLSQALEARRDVDFSKESEFIRRSLEGELASSLFGSRGRIEASFDGDPQIQRALEVFANRPEYDKLLAIVPTDKGQ